MSKAAKATIKGNTLIFEIPIGDPKPSSTGKTILIGTASGATAVTLKIPGTGERVIHLTANAYVYPTDKKAA